MLTFFFFWFLSWNVLAFLLFGLDKLRAKRKRWRIPEVVLLACAVLGGAFGAGIGMLLFRHKIRKTAFRIIIPFFLLIQIAWLVILAVFTAKIIDYSGRDETPDHADAAIVLGAGTENGEVTPVFAERINHAVSLYREHKVDWVILTGGVSEGNDRSDASIAYTYAVEHGMDADRIMLEESSTTTEENLFGARELLWDHHLKTADIVSDPLHMKRAMLLANDLRLNCYSSPTPTTRYRGFQSCLRFLDREVFFYMLAYLS